MCFKKGEGKLGEDIAVDKMDYIVTQTFTATLRKNGDFKSTIIGPASDWGNLKWAVGEYEEPDTFSIAVYGISTTNDTLELLKTTDYSSDLTFINAQEYPYIFIKYQA